jgi:hypothetical protein
MDPFSEERIEPPRQNGPRLQLEHVAYQLDRGAVGRLAKLTRSASHIEHTEPLVG